MTRGFSLIEVMIAMAVLVVGLLGGIAVIAVAGANDGRSKLHSTAILLAQSTMEKIAAIPAAAGNTQTTLTDCAGTPHTIETAVPAAGASPALIDSGAFSGTIDFSQPTVPNYSMVYVTCSSGNIGFDVRWRIDSGPTPATQLVTVSAKPLVTAGATQFMMPYTLHQLRGDF
jgi:prepilin-type N-terminal cleavage/methylation domain-containing protein